MNNIYSKFFPCIFWSFHLTCWTITTFLVSYWIYAYTLDHDLCIVDYKKYLETDSDEFPVLSICLKNQISEQKLQLQAPKVDIETYLSFLRGDIYEKELAKINHENVTNDISKYVTGSKVVYRNGTVDSTNQRQAFRKSYAFFHQRHQRAGLYQCYELQVPNVKEFKFMTVSIKSEAFPPRNRSQNYEMQTYLHYPNHLFASNKNTKYTWPLLKSNDGYLSRYVIENVEIIKRRNKATRLCVEWDNHDDTIVKDHIKNVGCRAPYQKAMDGVELCSTKESMKNASLLRIRDEHMLHPPCRYMSKILYKFVESDMSRTKLYKKGQIAIGIFYFDATFREIVQTRYCIQMQASHISWIFNTKPSD